MRFRRLELLAFGHFSGTVLEFAEPSPGLHVVYGNNEAGKSTALRAIRSFLYGIPHQSRDTFVHAGSELRLGAELCTESGDVLCAVRRKGRKNTLLAPDGAPIAESQLQSLTVDENLFGAMFGLDHETLRHGAQELLEGKAGESLFGAAIGTASVRRLRSRLNDAADELFTAKGRNKQINQRINDLRAAKQVVTEQSSSAVAHAARERALADAQEKLRSTLEARNARRSEKSRLERQLRVLPLLAQRQQRVDQLRQLGQLPSLPRDAEQRRVAAERQLAEASQKLSHERVEIERVERRVAALGGGSELLEISEQVLAELTSELGQHRKAMADLPKRQGELSALLTEVEQILSALGSDLPPERGAELRLSRIEHSRLERLAREKTQYDTKIGDATEKLKRARAVQERRGQALATLPEVRDTTALEAAYARAQRTLGVQQRLHEARLLLKKKQQRVDQVRAALSGYDGSPELLLELPIPSEESIASFDSRQGELQGELREVAAAERRLAELAVELKRERLELLAGTDVPSLVELKDLRRQRDAALRQVLEGRKSSALAAAKQRLPQLVESADTLADRLFAEANRVSRLASIDARIAECEAKVEQAGLHRESIARASEQWDEQWRASWRPCHVHPASPREMIAWLRRSSELIGLLDERRSASDECRALERQVAELSDELSAALQSVGQEPRQLWEVTLETLVERVGKVIAETQRTAREREDVQRSLALERQQVEQLEAELEQHVEQEKAWRGDWYKALRQLRLSKTAGPEEVTGALAQLTDLYAKLDDVAALRSRIDGMRRDSQQLTQRIDALIARCLPELSGGDLVRRAEGLLDAARRARADHDERLRLQDELERRRAQRDSAQAHQGRARAELDELRAQAGAKDLAELVLVEERLDRARELGAAIASLEEQIVAEGEGASLQDLVEQCRGTDSETARERIAALEPKIIEADELVGHWQAQAATLEQDVRRSEAGASRAAEDLASCTASLETSVQRYVRLKLAAAILDAEVERYRDAHQGPVLRVASELFPKLTLGAYSGLKVGFDADDQQVLLCVRSDGREVRTDGLSDGTRDQLYLALRLASLSHYIDGREPMPLVLDDVLVHFDDPRAAAALSVLSDVAERVQVLFFTHHRRIVELAQNAVDPARLAIHELGQAPQARVA